jgi:hypothetical protein
MANQKQRRKNNMKRKAKGDCCRCGFCCMQEACEYAILIEAHNEHKYGICPLLKYNEQTKKATCIASDSELTREGVGCESTQTVLLKKKGTDSFENVLFIGLSEEHKKMVASSRWEQRIKIYKELKDEPRKKAGSCIKLLKS